MDGIGIPILGAVDSLVLLLLCLAVPRLRSLSLAALTSPFIASIVLLLGGFILADMNYQWLPNQRPCVVASHIYLRKGEIYGVGCLSEIGTHRYEANAKGNDIVA